MSRDLTDPEFEEELDSSGDSSAAASQKLEYVIPEGSGGGRLDAVLSAEFRDLSRSRIQSLIKEGLVTLNGKSTKPRAATAVGDLVEINIPEVASAEALPEDIPLDILFEDEDIIVINKACGLVVHPAAGNPSGTLVNALLHHCGDLSGIGGVLRPGIVHRLDKDTSGCMVAAKNDTAHRHLAGQFENRTAKKAYLAAVERRPASGEGEGSIHNRIGRHPVDRKRMAVLSNEKAGKPAITDWQLLGGDETSSLILCKIHTGRTHQIRVHMKEVLHCPILGDPIYAKPQRQKVKVPRLMLHAWRLTITHPSDDRVLNFEAPVPSEFAKWSEFVPN